MLLFLYNSKSSKFGVHVILYTQSTSQIGPATSQELYDHLRLLWGTGSKSPRARPFLPCSPGEVSPGAGSALAHARPASLHSGTPGRTPQAAWAPPSPRDCGIPSLRAGELRPGEPASPTPDPCRKPPRALPARMRPCAMASAMRPAPTKPTRHGSDPAAAISPLPAPGPADRQWAAPPRPAPSSSIGCRAARPAPPARLRAGALWLAALWGGAPQVAGPRRPGSSLAAGRRPGLR